MSKPIQERAFRFALQVIAQHRLICTDSVGRVLALQLLRSATAVGANMEEADAAHTKREFIHKVRLALKECRESLYWIRLLEASQLLRDQSLLQEANEIVSILTSISRHAQNNPSRGSPNQ